MKKLILTFVLFTLTFIGYSQSNSLTIINNTAVELTITIGVGTDCAGGICYTTQVIPAAGTDLGGGEFATGVFQTGPICAPSHFWLGAGVDGVGITGGVPSPCVPCGDPSLTGASWSWAGCDSAYETLTIF